MIFSDLVETIFLFFISVIFYHLKMSMELYKVMSCISLYATVLGLVAITPHINKLIAGTDQKFMWLRLKNWQTCDVWSSCNYILHQSPIGLDKTV